MKTTSKALRGILNKILAGLVAGMVKLFRLLFADITWNLTYNRKEKVGQPVARRTFKILGVAPPKVAVSATCCG